MSYVSSAKRGHRAVVSCSGRFFRVSVLFRLFDSQRVGSLDEIRGLDDSPTPSRQAQQSIEKRIVGLASPSHWVPGPIHLECRVVACRRAGLPGCGLPAEHGSARGHGLKVCIEPRDSRSWPLAAVAATVLVGQSTEYEPRDHISTSTMHSGGEGAASRSRNLGETTAGERGHPGRVSTLYRRLRVSERELRAGWKKRRVCVVLASLPSAVL